MVDGPLAFNTIVGRPAIHHFRVVPSTYHQVIKLPTPNGMRTVDGQQRASYECYATAIKRPRTICAIDIQDDGPEPGSPVGKPPLEEKQNAAVTDMVAEQEKSIPSGEELEVVLI